MIQHLDSKICGEPKSFLKGYAMHRVIEFNEQSAAEFSRYIDAVNSTSQPHTILEIDSFGGDVYALRSMLSDMRRCQVPIYTIVKGKAMSCGGFLASFGTIGCRYADKRSTIMFHDLSAVVGGNPEDIERLSTHLKDFSKTVFQDLEEHCSVQPGTYTDIAKYGRDHYYTPTQARKVKLIDHVGVPNLHLKVDVEYLIK